MAAMARAGAHWLPRLGSQAARAHEGAAGKHRTGPGEVEPHGRRGNRSQASDRLEKGASDGRCAAASIRFQGGVGACRRCGEVATAMSAAASANAERNAPPVPTVREVQQNESFR
jgi:hypothetical protein